MQIEELIVKYLTGNLSEDEKCFLQQWLEEDIAHQTFLQDVCSKKDLLVTYEQYRHYDRESKKAFQKVWNSVQKESMSSQRLKWFILKPYWLKIVGFVIVPLLLSILLYIQYSNRNVILPGESKALLILGNGEAKELRSSRQASWIYIDNKPVARDYGGMISYHTPDSLKSDSYNTLVVPRGGEYRLTLSDGTAVHLNSSSELRYPVYFKKGERIVELEGEAYFEVSKDSSRPFYIKTNGILIKQFGTEFNVRSRTSKNIEIALVKGSIGVQTAYDKMQKLSPGQLAVYDFDSKKIRIEDKNLLAYVAWHSDRFVFYNESLEELMEELSLWYDLDVEFRDHSAKKLHFTGSIHRYDDIAVILRAIEETVNVGFEIDGHHIIIDKKLN